VIWQNGKAVDMNTLVGGNSSLYLLSANDIDDEGVIAGQACVLINGACTAASETPAFVAIPNGDSDRENVGVARSQEASSIRVVVSGSVSQKIMRRHGIQMNAASANSQ
jgi:hypothetical protein